MTGASSKKKKKPGGPKPSNVYNDKYGFEKPFEAVWSAIRRLRVFTMAALYKDLSRKNIHGLQEATIKSYLKRLEKGGYVSMEIIPEEVSGLHGAAKIYQYTLLKNVGAEAPRLKADGSQTLQGRGNENMWRSMRMLRSFNFRDLALTASTDEITVHEQTARRYVKVLKAAGYLKEIQPANNTRPARYVLSKSTGPKAPQIQRNGNVYDPNKKIVIERSGVNE